MKLRVLNYGSLIANFARLINKTDRIYFEILDGTSLKGDGHFSVVATKSLRISVE